MSHDLTHASFFSGAGGLDLGIERAGWRTVSFSEIDPYASAVLAERWPGVPNLGDIVQLAGRVASEGRVRADAGGRVARDEPSRPAGDLGPAERDALERADGPGNAGLGDRGVGAAVGGDDVALRGPDWQQATLWTGGFPCQDLSVAGKRRGMGAGTRSGLAYAFLDLVERHRPPAVLLENVPGLLSSHAGRDFGALLAALGQLGYGWAYRVLDARHFGVPQRRRRVFILGIHARVDPAGTGAAEVLSVGARCPRHPATGHQAGPGAADGAVPGVDIARTVVGTAGKRHDEDIDTLIAGALTQRPYDDRGHEQRFLVGGRVDGLDDGEQLRVGDRGRAVPDPERDAAERVREPAAGHPPGVVSPAPDARRDRAPDGLAGRMDDRDGLEGITGGEQSYHQRDRIYGDLAPALDAYGDTPSDAPIVAYVKGHRDSSVDDDESWRVDDIAPTINGFDIGDTRATALALSAVHGAEGVAASLPLGLDSHRYRCCGNGVVSGVAEWIGLRLASWLEAEGAR